MTVTCDGHRLTYCAVFIFIFNVIVVVQVATHYHQCGQCLGFRVAPQMIHVLLPMRLNTRSQLDSVGKAEYTGNASGYLGSLVRQNSIMLNRFSHTAPCAQHPRCLMSDSSCRANPGADGEGTTSSSSMRENSVLRFLERAWLWRNPSSSPSSSLAMRVVGSRGCGASFELIDRS